MDDHLNNTIPSNIVAGNQIMNASINRELEELEEINKRNQELHKLLDGAFIDLTTEISFGTDDESESNIDQERKHDANTANVGTHAVSKDISVQMDGFETYFNGKSSTGELPLKNNENSDESLYHELNSVTSSQQVHQEQFLRCYKTPSRKFSKIRPSGPLQFSAYPIESTVNENRLTSTTLSCTENASNFLENVAPGNSSSEIIMDLNPKKKFRIALESTNIIEPKNSEGAVPESHEPFKTSFERNLRTLSMCCGSDDIQSSLPQEESSDTNVGHLLAAYKSQEQGDWISAKGDDSTVKITQDPIQQVDFQELYQKADFDAIHQLETLYAVRVNEVNRLRSELDQVIFEKEQSTKFFQNEICEKQNEIDRLQISLRSSRQLSASSQKSQKIANEMLESLQAKNSATEIECNKTQHELTVAQMKIVELESRLILCKESRGEKTLQDIQMMRKTHADEVAQLRGSLEHEANKVEQLEKRFNEVVKINDEQILNKMTTVNRLMDELEDARSQINTWQDEELIRTLVTENEELKTRVQQLQVRCDLAAANNRDVVKNASTKTTTPEKSYSVTVLQNELMRALTTLDEKREEIKRLNAVVEEQAESISALGRHNVQLDDKTALSTEASSSPVVESFQDQVAKLQQKLQSIPSLTKAYENLNEQYASLTASYMERSEQMGVLQAEISRLKEVLLKGQNESVKLINTSSQTVFVTAATLDSEKLIRVNEGLLADLEKMVAHSGAKETEVVTLRQQLNSNCEIMAGKISNLIKDFNQSRVNYEQTINDKLRKIDTLESTLKIKDVEINTLRHTITTLQDEYDKKTRNLLRAAERPEISVSNQYTQSDQQQHAVANVQVNLMDSEFGTLKQNHLRELAALKSSFKTTFEADMCKLKLQYSERIVKLQSEKNQMQKDFTVLENHCKRMVDRLQSDKESFKNILDNYRATLNEFNEKLHEPTARELQLIEERDKVKKDFEEYNAKISIVYTKYNKVKVEVKEAKENERAQQVQVVKLKREIQLLITKINAWKMEKERQIYRKRDAYAQVTVECSTKATQVSLSPKQCTRSHTSQRQLAARASSHGTVKPQLVSVPSNTSGVTIPWAAGLRSRESTVKSATQAKRCKRK